MRTSEFYGVQVPELGDRADITVVSQAIIDGEDNQSGKVENLKATSSGSTITLTSETRSDKLVKYYNGLAIQFISPVNASAGTSYKIKIDNLAEQPFNNKVDIKVGDIVQAVYGSTGFVSANTPIPRSSSVASTSEITVATSKAVKQAYDKGVEGLNKANTKLDAGSVSVDYNSGKKIEDKIKDKFDKTGGTITGNVKIETTDNVQSLAIVNPAVGSVRNSTMYLGFRNNVARIRLFGGSNVIRDNGFNIEANEDKVLFRVDNNGDIFAKGTDKCLTLKTKEFLGNSGVSAIMYIQDAGTKTKGNGYVDKVTGRLYRCLETTEEVNIKPELFEPADNINTSKKFDDLVKYKVYSTSNMTNNFDYPDGYNENNCIALPYVQGNTESDHYTVKINQYLKKFVVNIVRGNWPATVVLVFIKTDGGFSM